MIEKPLMQNPLSGGLGQIIPNPGAGIADRFPGNPNRKPPDPIMQGFQESEFRKRANNMQQDAVYFKYKGKDMQMNSSMAGAFKQYLDSIGKGDLYDSGLQLSGPLQQVGIDNQLNATDPGPLGPPILDGTPSVNPIVTGPEEIASAETNPFNRVGQQLTGPDQFGDLNSRLNKIEQGIISLLGNRGQNSSMNFNSPYNFNWGLSSFPPYGGMYG